MYSKKLRTTVSLILVFMLSFLSVLEVSAASLKATVASRDYSLNGKQSITVNSVVDVTYDELKNLRDVKFILSKGGTEVASAVKPRSEARITVLDTVYSLEYNGIPFEGLVAGQEYSLQAQYQGEKGTLLTTPSQSIYVPASAGIDIAVERMTKDSNTYISASAGEIRSDDANVRLTIRSGGVPLANESVAIWSNYQSYHYRTDASGQIRLKDNAELVMNKPVMIVMLRQGGEQYEAKPIYVTDLQQPNTYTVAVRYTDINGRLLSNVLMNQYSLSGIEDSFTVPGYNVLVFRTGAISGYLRAYVTTTNSETYLFETPLSSLNSTVPGIHKELIEGGGDYSRLNLRYTWDGKAVNIESYSFMDNSPYKQLNNNVNTQTPSGNIVYAKKNKEYEITAVGTVPGVTGKMVIRNTFKPVDANHEVVYAAQSADYSLLNLQVPALGADQGQIQLSYINSRFNYSKFNITVPAANGKLYVKKGEQIHRLTSTPVTTTANNRNQIVLNSFFSPSDSEYTFKGGSTYTTKLSTRVPDPTYYGEAEVRNRVVLGESVETLVEATDEYGNIIDLVDNKLVITNEAGTVIADDYLSWTTQEQEGKLQRVNMRQWKPATAGVFKIQLFANAYSNQGQLVRGALLSETELTVLPKNELDVEIRGKDGKLVDLVDKPYLTVEQAQNITITVREHTTGTQGQPLAGVTISRYNEVLGVTDSQGTYAIPADHAYYLGQLNFKKADYLAKQVNVTIINPETQAVVRVRGLDKAEGQTYAGGVPLDYASIQAVVKGDDGSYSRGSFFLNISDTQAFLVVDAPSVAGIDFIRYNRSYSGVESKYGYYMYGSVRTAPGKEYSLVLDARQELQEVSKVLVDKSLEDLYIVRKELAGAENLPYVMDSNEEAGNYFYATQGTYSVLAQTTRGTFVYRDDVEVGAGDNHLSIDDSAAGLATLVAPDSGTIYSVKYTTPNKSSLNSYAYNSTQVQLTPGDVTVQVDYSLGTAEYQYDIHFAPGTLQAGMTTQLAPQTLQGLDVVGLQNGKLIRPAGATSLLIGLVDTAGNQIGQIKKPQILVTNGGWSNGSRMLNPEQGSYEIQNEAGETLYEEDSLNYPLYAFTYDYNNSQYLTDGTYVIKASMTIDGQTYTLDKKITLETATGTVVDPGQNPGTDIGGGDNSGTTPTPKPSATPSPTASSDTTGPGAPGPAATPAVASPSPAATAAVNENVQQQNNKLQDLLKDTSGSAAEKAAAAQNALSSIAESLKSANTPQQAEQNGKNLSTAMDSAAKLLQTIQDPAEKQKIVSSVTDLVGSAPYLLSKLDSSEKAVAVAQALIDNAAAVLNNMQGVKAEEIQKLKDGVISSSQAALNKAGEVTIAKENVKVEGNAVSSQLDSGLISTQIQSAKQALASVTNELTSKIGAGTAADLKLTLTVKVPPVSEGIHKLNTSLPSDILALVKENDIAGLKIQMDQTAFTIAPDTFGTIAAGQKINLAAEVVENAVINKPRQAEPLATIPVMEFSASVGDQPVKSFAKPIDVTFDVSAMDTSKYTAANLENLTVYVLNEESLTWEAVGGKYDPVTQTVTAPRGHFSKYTVMLGAASFTDVPASHWAVKEINYLLTKGIVDSSEKFSPSGKVTRQQFAAMIARAYGLDGTGLSVPFKDIAAANPYADEIAAAYAAGIITGKSAEAFDPEATITREEIATMLARALTTYNGTAAVTQPAAVNAAFTDGAKIAKWAASSVALTKSIHLFEGFEDHSFRPAQTASKAEAAALIYRLYQLK